jgi:hypothetical protein
MSGFETDFDFFGLVGGLSGETVHCHMASLGALAGSSSSLPGG